MEFGLIVEKNEGTPPKRLKSGAASEAGDIIIQVNSLVRATIVLPGRVLEDRGSWAALLDGRQPSPPLSGIELGGDGHMIAFSTSFCGNDSEVVGKLWEGKIELPRLLIAPKLREVMNLGEQAGGP